MHAEQDAGQILQGTSGSFETLTASGVLSLETSSADSQISSPFACKFLPALEYFPGDGDFVHLSIKLRGEKISEKAVDIWKRFSQSYFTTD